MRLARSLIWTSGRPPAGSACSTFRRSWWVPASLPQPSLIPGCIYRHHAAMAQPRRPLRSTFRGFRSAMQAWFFHEEMRIDRQIEMGWLVVVLSIDRPSLARPYIYIYSTPHTASSDIQSSRHPINRLHRPTFLQRRRRRLVCRMPGRHFHSPPLHLWSIRLLRCTISRARSACPLLWPQARPDV